MTNSGQVTDAGVVSPEILFVSGTLDVGGAERHLLQIVRPLILRGWRVSLYCIAGDGPLRGDFENAGANVVLPPFRRRGEAMSLPTRFWRLIVGGAHLFFWLVRSRPAIVHMFLPSAYVFAAPLSIMASARIRIMSRRSLNLYKRDRPLLWRLEQPLHRWMTAILGNSRSIVHELRDHEGVPATRLGLIYNGVDPKPVAESREALRSALGLSGDTLGLVIVANLIPYKGHADLLDALGRASPKLSFAWRLFVVGHDYGIGSALKAQAQSLGIADKVSFLGSRMDASDILQACDLGLLVSHQEGFSNAIIEGMAAGLPMIVTDVGGNAEAVVDGQTGIVVPPRDPDGLAAAIVRLGANRAIREQMGAAGRHRVNDKFSLERAVDSYDRLYRTLLAGGALRDLPQLQVTD